MPAGRDSADASAPVTTAGRGGAGGAGGTGARAGTTGRAGAGAGGKGAAGNAAGSTAAGSGGQTGMFAADTFLPWAGGPAYFAKWKNGPPSDSSFFPIAVWLQSPANAPRYKEVGINLFVGLWEGPTESQLTSLESAGVPTFCDQSGVWREHLGDSPIWGWLQGDEPDNAQAKEGGGYDPCIEPSAVVADYQQMVSNDASRPVWLNLGRGVSDTEWVGRGTCTGKTDMYPEYAKGGDILSFDIYPVNGGAGLEAVPNGVDNLRKWSDYEKPVVAIIEGSNIDDTTRPTPAQIESEVWMALIHGAAGIQYFCHRFSPTFSETDCLDNAATADGLERINARVTALAPVLNLQSVGNGVTVTYSDASQPVDAMLKRTPDATYVFAAQMRSGSTTAKLTLRDFPASASAEVLDENRRIAIVDGVFEDSFKSYGVHRYKIAH